MTRFATLVFGLLPTLGAFNVTSGLSYGADDPPQPPKATAAAPEPQRRGRAGFGGKIELGPDDHAAFPDPAAGFDVLRDGTPVGRLELIEDDSKTVGTRRKMQVYTPLNYYSPDTKYPVLYLLHGMGGDETEWQRFATPNVIRSQSEIAARAHPGSGGRRGTTEAALPVVRQSGWIDPHQPRCACLGRATVDSARLACRRPP